jgi:hypothetical protein
MFRLRSCSIRRRAVDTRPYHPAWPATFVATVSHAQNRVMGATDDELDATSRRLLNEIDELKRLELEKRRTARSSPEFHDLASKVDNAARHVFDSTGSQLIEGTQESPLDAERQEQHPGDWTEGSRN